MDKDPRDKLLDAIETYVQSRLEAALEAPESDIIRRLKQMKRERDKADALYHGVSVTNQSLIETIGKMRERIIELERALNL